MSSCYHFNFHYLLLFQLQKQLRWLSFGCMGVKVIACLQENAEWWTQAKHFFCSTCLEWTVIRLLFNSSQGCVEFCAVIKMIKHVRYFLLMHACKNVSFLLLILFSPNVSIVIANSPNFLSVASTDEKDKNTDCRYIRVWL